MLDICNSVWKRRNLALMLLHDFENIFWWQYKDMLRLLQQSETRMLFVPNGEDSRELYNQERRRAYGASDLSTGSILLEGNVWTSWLTDVFQF